MSNKFLIENLPETTEALSSDLFIVERENETLKVDAVSMSKSVVSVLSASGLDLMASTIIRKWHSDDTGQYVVAFESAIEHGSVSVSKEGVTLSPGDVVGFGETITVTVYPDTGYQVGSLKINGASVASGSQYVVYSDVTIVAQVEQIPVPEPPSVAGVLPSSVFAASQPHQADTQDEDQTKTPKRRKTVKKTRKTSKKQSAENSEG